MITKGLVLLLLITTSQADIIVNAARPITHKVNVNRIRTQDGANQAKTFGTPSQETDIVDSINEIWAQAGVQIVFSSYTSYESAFAYDNNGQDPNTVRSQGDLSTILNLGDAPTTASSTDIEMFFVEIVPGFKKLSENSTNGLARLDRSGTAVQVGDNLPGFQNGRDVVAGVMAHEIGHNLGLDHTANGLANLMSPSGTSDQITQAQIDTIFTNNSGTDGFDLLIPLNYSEWATANNVSLGANGDDDLDQLPNLTEFALGLNPAVPNYDAPRPIPTAGNTLTWTLPKSAGAIAAGLIFEISVSTDLTNWSPAGTPGTNSTLLYDNNSEISARLNPTGNGGYFRLEVQQP